MADMYEMMHRIEERISELPEGYISKKTIKGKEQYYRQWKENGKLKSKYIRADELEQMQAQIEERKKLQARLKDIQKKYAKENGMQFETRIKTGKELKLLVSVVKNLKKRDIFYRIPQYLQSDIRTRVCIVYGLRRTGKTTMLLQAIADMSDEDFSKTAYVKMRTTDEMNNIIRDLDRLNEMGFKYIFIDEVTLMEDFIDSASMFSDIYTMMGMKIVLSGTDSLGFWLAEANELYDRARMIHTTSIPYREYSRLLGIDSMDEYIRYGGTLRPGEIDFNDEELRNEGVAFRDDESMRRYIDTAICQNIQHSLDCFRYGEYYGRLQDLRGKGELTGAINRIIEDMNHRFVADVLTRDFKSNDLGITVRNLKNERDPSKRTDISQLADIQSVTDTLMGLLEIKNKENQTVEITDSHVLQIKNYLKGLDLIVDCPIENGELGIEPENRVLFTQPGMRYCQAQALVHSLMQDETFSLLEEEQKKAITERILEEVRGRMLEDIVLLETMKALGRNYDVFKLRFSRGEYDMVIYDKKNNSCAIYEIKHSDKCVKDQARHLLNEEMLAKTSPRFGTLEGRYVLYLGENLDTEDGIAYRNAEQFLKNLPEITLESGLEETVSEDEDEDQGFEQTM